MKNLLGGFWVMLPALLLFSLPAGQGWAQGLSLKIVYDNTAYDQAMAPDWGFACLVKYSGMTLLFDTGKEGEILLDNFQIMGEDPQDVDAVVISHNHQDHIGGLFDFLQVNPEVRVCLADPRQEDLSRLESMGVQYYKTPEPVSLYNAIKLSGAMGRGIPEQALVITTPAGLILVAGCSHPGIVNMIKQVKETFLQPVYLVLGGFHTMPETPEGMRQVIQEFKELGVQKVAPAHCTNETARAWFKRAYAQDYIQAGAGRELHFRLQDR